MPPVAPRPPAVPSGRSPAALGLLDAALAALGACPACRARRAGPEGACGACLAALAPRHGPGRVALGPYRGGTGRLARALKSGRRRRLAAPLGRALARAAAGRGWRPDAVVAVPTSRARARERGFDHAAALADAVASVLGVARVEGVERLAGPEGRQAGRRARARRAGVRAVYRATAALPPGSVVVLVDDVRTSGATLAACAAALAAAGVRTAGYLVVADADPGPPRPAGVRR